MGDYRYIVTRAVPSLQMMRVDVDNRKHFEVRRARHEEGWTCPPETNGVKTHRPQTLRARLWRMILGG